MPVVRRRRWGRFVGSALTGWGHQHCFLESPLLFRGSEEIAAEATSTRPDTRLDSLHSTVFLPMDRWHPRSRLPVMRSA